MLTKIRSFLNKAFPDSVRETIYRIVAAAIMGLATTGTLTTDRATLWANLAVATLTLLFAMLNTGVGLRALLYGVIAAGGGLLMAYGIVNNLVWAIAIAAIGQGLGVATAAAKAVPAAKSPKPPAAREAA